MHNFSVVLYTPEIPGNTGTIGRSCLALNLRLILIRPYGFNLSEKAVRRAGLDYWKYVNLVEYDSWEQFIKEEKVMSSQLFFLSTKVDKTYFSAEFTTQSYLVFGPETKGLPKFLFDEYPNQFLKIPMYSDKVRSLNLANAATAVMYEAIRQIHFPTR